MPARLQYQIKQSDLIVVYENYITRWPGNRKRLPTVMYFRSILNEIRPDVSDIVDGEVLRFYSDYPFADNNSDWRDLFDEFPESHESIEACWRIAMSEAGSRNFEDAQEICQTSLIRIDNAMKEFTDSVENESGSIFAAFRKPVLTVMTPFKLHDLESRFRKLQSLISIENRGKDEESFKRLAEFVMLNPHDERSYAAGLNGLFERMSRDDELRDNILLAKAMLIDDNHRREQLLEKVAKQYSKRDAGIQARFELGMTKIKLWKDPNSSKEKKNQLLIDSHKILSDFIAPDFIEKHPNCFLSKQAGEMLQTLPQPQ
jgi:hypothetical protein